MGTRAISGWKSAGVLSEDLCVVVEAMGCVGEGISRLQ
jgi:hypothetical protein